MDQLQVLYDELQPHQLYTLEVLLWPQGPVITLMHRRAPVYVRLDGVERMVQSDTASGLLALLSGKDPSRVWEETVAPSDTGRAPSRHIWVVR